MAAVTRMRPASITSVHPAAVVRSRSIVARSAVTSQAISNEAPALQRFAQGAVAVVVAAQLALAPFAGPAWAALDTETAPAPQAGTAAKVEGSNLADQSGRDALAQLSDVAIPNAEAALTKMDSSEAKSAYLELNAVTEAVSSLNERVQKLSDSELKSEVSGVEQQLNAAKSTAGLD